jgi:hypothetical protein
VSQPELPVPLVVQFPFPAWATRSGEAGSTLVGAPGAGDVDDATPRNGSSPAVNGSPVRADDPFAGFPTG